MNEQTTVFAFAKTRSAREERFLRREEEKQTSKPVKCAEARMTASGVLLRRSAGKHQESSQVNVTVCTQKTKSPLRCGLFRYVTQQTVAEAAAKLRGAKMNEQTTVFAFAKTRSAREERFLRREEEKQTSKPVKCAEARMTASGVLLRRSAGKHQESSQVNVTVCTQKIKKPA